ncbi:MAG: hypothetical protein CMC13_09030 [Flavobacteriaceae bacterium]|nr:hypothetical protein [Flavobacteriaceae bacterium]|tara:strand:- start:2130 stop:2858 length:729 start_codon:yes stop_codon:yes gene_type:complete
MIKFFRHIRKRLIRENRFSKYLLYAIGEIVLVVIGILIALQINNWNEEKALSETELNILNVMLKNIQSDLGDMEFNVTFYNIRLKANQTVLQALKDPDNVPDTLAYTYANLGSNPYFIESTSAFDNLKSIGFEIIQNESLREEIMQLYGIKYQWMGELEDDHAKFYANKLEPLLLENFETAVPFESAAPVVELQELAKNHIFKEALRYNSAWTFYILGRYQEATEAAESLKKNIQAEIDKRQ